MAVLQAIRQRARRRLLSPAGLPALDWWPVQRVLGFQRSGMGVVDRLGDVRLEYDPRTVIGGQLFVLGAFEEREIRFFARLLSTLDAPVVLDAGANLGLHAISWAKSRPSARLFAFEPSRRTLNFLRHNVELNGLGARIEVIEEALSDHRGTGEFFHCEDDAYSSLRDTRRQRVVDTYQVIIGTIDDFVQSRALARVDLIKIDVEGFEREVLLGGERVMKEFRPHLFVEIFGGTHSNPDPAGTINFVRSRGYDAFVLKDGMPEPYITHSDAFFNYYFRPTP